jgi:GNAT superfamily N-acetyltransferase
LLSDGGPRRRARARAARRGLEALGAALSSEHADLSIEQARDADTEIVASILVEAAQWLIDCGRPLWRPEDLTPDRVRPEVVGGHLYLAKLGGEAVGTFALHWEDRVFWAEFPAGDAAYVHRLAVRRRLAGKGVAVAMLAFARAEARSAGRRWLRLDCSADHPRLGTYYEENGFTRHSEARVGPYTMVRFEQTLS